MDRRKRTGDEPIQTDVLIAGGGIQGLALLRELVGAGVRRVFLASATELGCGETLHSHGYMHHGYAMSAAAGAEQMVRELKDAASWWRGRLRPPYAPGPPVYYGLPPQAEPERTNLWERLGIPHRKVTDIPAALRHGEADGEQMRLFSIDDRLVSMRAILSDLVSPLQDRIVRARLTSIDLDENGTSVASCRLSTDHGEISVRPRVLLLACGREAQPLLRAARTSRGNRPLESTCAGLNRIRFVPMLLVRGAHLPEISGIFETHALSMFTHPVEQGESMWILTLMEGHDTDREDFDGRRETEPGGAFVARTVERLYALVPEARRRRDRDLRFSFYFGGKTDHPEGGNGRYVDSCGLTNLRLAWPGVWSLSVVNARTIARDLRSSSEFGPIFDGSGPALDLEGLATGVPVGEELRLTGALAWHPWPEFARVQGIL